eukprot:9083339-Pyramimonas_sp.AAC.1
MAWRKTIVSYLGQHGFTRSLLEPCWCVRYGSKGEVLNMILLEVDDFFIGSSSESSRRWLRELLEARFKFGKYRDCHSGPVDYAGRRITIGPQRATVDMEKYILEEVRPVTVQKGRLARRDLPLEPEEFKALRSLVYKFNWIGRETRPEAAGVASILASRLKAATTGDISLANKLVRHLRSSASRGLIVWKLDPEQMSFMSFSDAGGVGAFDDLTDEKGLPEDPTQGAWMILACDKSVLSN